MEIIESEHQKNLLQDSWRLPQAFRSSAISSSPFNKFATGNKETLDQPDIHSALIKFYKTYYRCAFLSLFYVH